MIDFGPLSESKALRIALLNFRLRQSYAWHECFDRLDRSSGCCDGPCTLNFLLRAGDLQLLALVLARPDLNVRLAQEDDLRLDLLDDEILDLEPSLLFARRRTSVNVNAPDCVLMRSAGR